MSSFNVNPDALADGGSRFSGLSGTINDHATAIAGTSGSAAGTGIHEAFEGLVSQWSAALPRFAGSTDSLSRGLHATAAYYAKTDATIGFSLERSI